MDALELAEFYAAQIRKRIAGCESVLQSDEMSDTQKSYWYGELLLLNMVLMQHETLIIAIRNQG